MRQPLGSSLANGAGQDLVYDHAAQALGTGSLPTFEGFSGEQVARAFREPFPGLNPDPRWLEEFKGRVARLSNGTARLLDGNPDEFVFRPKGPVVYLVLERAGMRQRLLVLPTANPIVFDS